MTRTNEQQDALLDALRNKANGGAWVDPEAALAKPMPPFDLRADVTVPGNLTVTWGYLSVVSAFRMSIVGPLTKQDIAAGTSRSRTYTALDAGTYTVVVEAQSAAGTLSEAVMVTASVTGPTPPGLYAEIGGIPAGAKPVSACDVSGLTGDILLTDGKYTASKGISANLYAEVVGIVINGKSGQQVQLAKGVKLGGVTFIGFGLAKDTDGTHAGIVTADGCKLDTVEVTKGVGVGILFKGKGLESYDGHYHHNGASGRMIRSRGDNVTPGSGFHEVRSHIHHNNIGGPNSDAANKATQTSDYLGEDLRIHDEEEGALWFDISCWGCILKNPNIRNITTTAEWYRAVGVRFELNIYGTYPSGIYGGYIGDLAGSAVAVNESSNIEVKGVTIGPCKNSLELRQQTRSDDPKDGTLDPANWYKPASKPRTGPGRPGGAKLAWETFAVTFTGNTLLPGAGPLTLSDSNGTISPKTKDLSQAKNRIVVSGNTGNVVVKIPA